MGGLPFFISLLCLVYVSLLNIRFLIPLIDPQSIVNLGWFIAGILFGLWIAGLLIQGHWSVFIHELKHSALSNLVGNKFKSFKIKKDHGHFKYEYTKATAKYNAMIALAPYFLPLFTAPGCILIYIFMQKSLYLAILFLGVLYGIDMLLNIRDIGDHQTDFTEINGGYYIGLSFVIFMNLSIITFLLAWVFHQWQGTKLIFLEHVLFWNQITNL